MTNRFTQKHVEQLLDVWPALYEAVTSPAAVQSGKYLHKKDRQALIKEFDARNLPHTGVISSPSELKFSAWCIGFVMVEYEKPLTKVKGISFVPNAVTIFSTVEEAQDTVLGRRGLSGKPLLPLRSVGLFSGWQEGAIEWMLEAKYYDFYDALDAALNRLARNGKEATPLHPRTPGSKNNGKGMRRGVSSQHLGDATAQKMGKGRKLRRYEKKGVKLTTTPYLRLMEQEQKQRSDF
jgi:hypothetical protein